MSSHCSQRTIDLHHAQVTNGKASREYKQAERLRSFLEGRQAVRYKQRWVMVFSFIWFVYINIATALYLGYIL